MAAVEHLAGQDVDGRQHCTRCGLVLADRRTDERRDVQRFDAAPAALSWAVGARVAVEGRSAWVSAAPIGELEPCRTVRRG